MFFKRNIKGSTAKSRSCLCGKKTCQEISKKFRNFGDIRGDFAKLPNPQTPNEKDDFWIKRFKVHHKVDNMEEQVFNHTKVTKKVTLLSAYKQQKKDAFVARWHYPEILISKYQTDIPRFLSRKEAEDLHLIGNNQNTRSIYTKQDCIFQAKKSTKKAKKNTVKLDTEEYVALIPNVVDERHINLVLKELPSYIEEDKVKEDALKIRTAPKRGIAVSLISSSSSNDPDGKRPYKKQKFTEEFEKDETELMEFEKKQLVKLAKQANDAFKAMQQEVTTLNKKNEILQQTVQKREQEDTSAKDKVEIEHLQKHCADLQVEVAKLKKCGLNRFSMSNKGFFKENRRACKDLYGFKDFEFLIGFIEDVLGVPYDTPTKPFAKGGKNGENKLTEFEEVLLAMFYCNSNFNFATIGSLFGVKSRITVSNFINKWVPVLGETGDMLSTFTPWIDEEVLEILKPEWYKKLGLDNIAAVIDGKDFMCETVRTDRYLNSAQASNKVNHSAFRLLTWSLPCGTVVQRTPGFFGRASEKAILRVWGAEGRLKFPKGKCILGDKGFDNTAGSYTNFNTTLHPSFLTNEQFTFDQVNHNVLICKKRYTCEVVYSRVVTVKKLGNILEREHFQYIESLLGWGHGIANICYGDLQKVEV
jgi:hypothetical protein